MKKGKDNYLEIRERTGKATGKPPKKQCLIENDQGVEVPFKNGYHSPAPK